MNQINENLEERMQYKTTFDKLPKYITKKYKGCVEYCDREFARKELENSLNNDDLDSFFKILRKVIIAQSSFSEVALRAKMGRESLYKSVRTGAVRFTTICKVLKALEYDCQILAKQKM